MSLNLGTQNNQFQFSLPADFVPQSLEDRYMPLLKAYRKPYNSVIDYINSTIQDIDFPDITYPTVTQTLRYGKETYWKGDQNIYDLFSKKGTITFANVDSNMNYIIILNCLNHGYLNVNKTYDDNLIMTIVDENRKAIFHVQFRSLIFTHLDGTKFGYNDQSIQTKNFTINFVYNYLDIEFLYDKTDIIREQQNILIPPPNGQQ